MRSTTPRPARVPGSPRRLDAFTIIELLVVLTVITMLIAILLPSLSKARESSRQLQCAAGTRTMAQAVLFYEQDWKMFIPTQWYNSAPTPDAAVVNPYLGYSDTETPDRGRIYFRNKGCPSWVFSSVSDGGLPVWAFNRHITADATNTVGISFLNRTTQDVKFSSEVFMWTDNQATVTGGTGGLWHNTGIALVTIGTYPINGTTAILPRHESMGVNFSFVDGHASFVRIEGGGTVSYTPKPSYFPYKPRQSDYVNN